MSFASEFREFAMKGSVVDLAVGVIIGGAFGKIVDSMVNDLIMPIIGRIIGKVDFTNLFIPLSDIPPGTPQTLDALRKAGVPVLAYGNFITIADQLSDPGTHHLCDGKAGEQTEEGDPTCPGGNSRGRGPPARDPRRVEGAGEPGQLGSGRSRRRPTAIEAGQDD